MANCHWRPLSIPHPGRAGTDAHGCSLSCGHQGMGPKCHLIGATGKSPEEVALITHVVDKETEAREDKASRSRSHGGEWLSQDLPGRQRPR